MLINKDLLQELYEDAGYERTRRAREYVREGKIDIKKMEYEDSNNFEITAKAEGNYGDYEVNISVKKGELDIASCECKDYQKTYGVCKHILATLIKFEQTKFWEREEINKGAQKEKAKNDIKYREFDRILNDFYNEQIMEINAGDMEELSEEDKIKIEPKIIFEKMESTLKLEFKLGNKKMYKIKDLADFYTRVINNEFYKYGQKLEFVHNIDNFDDSSKDLLAFILKYAEIVKYSNKLDRYDYYYNTKPNITTLVLGTSTLDDAFDILKTKKVSFDLDYETTIMEFKDEDPEIEFELKKINNNECKIVTNTDIYSIRIFEGERYIYILKDNKLYRCSQNFKDSTVKLLKIFKKNYIAEARFKIEKLKDFYGIIMPQINENIKILGLEQEEIENYRPQKLAAKIYLDFDKNEYLSLEPKFCYGDEEFNPLDEKVVVKAIRNEIEENRLLNVFRKTGFLIDTENLRLVLTDDNKIYNFLSNEIETYMQKLEVMVTDNFKLREIKRPKIGSIGIKIENNLLDIDLSKINLDISDLEEVMSKYKLKKNFHRLKDGSFLVLEDNADLEFLDKLTSGMDINYKSIAENKVRLPISRSLYLNQLLKQIEGVSVSKNSEYKKVVNDLDKENMEEAKVPSQMENVLRDYQKLGFNWLKVLEQYNFGGILADDMGLGKTLQVLSIILNYVQTELENKRTSIVVCPSSLSLNWKKEGEKFASGLKIEVVRGKADERRQTIRNLQNYDLLITSYDLLKRDIEIYKERNYNFKYIIADEAQYLKNSNTQNAKSIKEIKGDTRFALTGTPIENSLAELWSIFDFIMPGYLFSYKKFKSLYEMPIVKDNDEKAMKKLKMLIEPFILRRTKKQVLVELPEKTISILNNDMEDEQEKIYMSYLSKAKQDIADEIRINGFENSHIKILAALTRLRQICCHPGLFIDGYQEGSSKLNQCMEILKDAIEAGHKILLFSGYTSMFEIIEKELVKYGIHYFKLIGSTKVDERIKLVDDFNSNPNVKVFLISLKAGGTGLNLTGADMVIHYDPWWNASAENQATDRAYRIGQKNNVQVYKLITNNSIEEKIYELQKKKAELIDNMLDTNLSFINRLSREEIMSLFE